MSLEKLAADAAEVRAEHQWDTRMSEFDARIKPDRVSADQDFEEYSTDIRTEVSSESYKAGDVDDYDPDKRIEATENVTSDYEQDSADNISSEEEADAEDEKSGETREEGYLTTYKERFDQTPTEGENGFWTGERGESRYKPNTETAKGASVAEKLSEYGLESIEYKNALPDFDRCAEESVQIDMTSDRYKNFDRADLACANKWNNEGKDGKTDWRPRDVENYRTEHKLTWHECADMKTCQMISQDIHKFYRHSGGIAECRKRAGLELGGGFDA